MRKERKNQKRGMIPSGLPCPVDSVEKAFHLQDEAPDLYITAFRPHAKVINLLRQRKKPAEE
jgi:hypothetical protein